MSVKTMIVFIVKFLLMKLFVHGVEKPILKAP